MGAVDYPAGVPDARRVLPPPAYETEQSRRSDVPDFRTTLYWDPAVRLDSDGQAQVEFFSSDATVAYEAIVAGVTDDGEIIRAGEFIPNNT